MPDLDSRNSVLVDGLAELPESLNSVWAIVQYLFHRRE